MTNILMYLPESVIFCFCLGKFTFRKVVDYSVALLAKSNNFVKNVDCHKVEHFIRSCWYKKKSDDEDSQTNLITVGTG